MPSSYVSSYTWVIHFENGPILAHTYVMISIFDKMTVLSGNEVDLLRYSA